MKNVFPSLFLFPQRIYDLGARKFVVSRIGQIGCTPTCVIRTPYFQKCNEDINQKVKHYSDKLPGKLRELQTQLPHSLFINLDNYNFSQKIRKSPENFGKQCLPLICWKKGLRNSCVFCIPIGSLLILLFITFSGFKNIIDSCVQGRKPCANRNEYYFFDFAHPTEATNKIYANECFSGTQLCLPYNIPKLIHAH